MKQQKQKMTLAQHGSMITNHRHTGDLSMREDPAVADGVLVLLPGLEVLLEYSRLRPLDDPLHLTTVI